MIPISEAHSTNTEMLGATLQSRALTLQPWTRNARSEFAEGGTTSSTPKDRRVVVTSILGVLHHEYQLEKIAALKD
jgi:hypothetical protein